VNLRRIAATVVVAAVLLSVAACTSDSGAAKAPQWGQLGADEKATYEYVVPNGTSVLLDAGQTLDIMPQELDVKVGDSLRIKNQDGRDYMIGPFYVSANQTLAMRFTNPGTLSGVCSMSSSGQIIIKVSK
jgi:hypothetical protein